MRHNLLLHVGATALLLGLASGCDRFGSSHEAIESHEAPSPEQLHKIAYLSSNPGPDGRKVYDRLEQAKTCGDFELAMRWNRPPDIEGGPFHQKIVYLTTNIPQDLPKKSEVFISATIERGETLPSGSEGWSLRMKDGSLAQAIETTSYWEKQEQASQDGKVVAIVSPNKPGRMLCAQGVYEGVIGKAPGQDQNVPLVSVLFAIDRAK